MIAGLISVGQAKRIRIERVRRRCEVKTHCGTDGFSYVDLNRRELTEEIEIIIQADMRSPEET